MRFDKNVLGNIEIRYYRSLQTDVSYKNLGLGFGKVAQEF